MIEQPVPAFRLLRAVVAFYGTAGQVDYSGARAAYLGHYAEVDEWEPIDEVRGTREAPRAAGCEVRFFLLPELSGRRIRRCACSGDNEV